MLKREYGNAVHQQEAQTENTSGNRQLTSATLLNALRRKIEYQPDEGPRPIGFTAKLVDQGSPIRRQLE